MVNVPSVSVDGESDPSNDDAEHAGAVRGYAADYALSKSAVVGVVPQKSPMAMRS